MTCEHKGKYLAKVLFPGGFHVGEFCSVCGKNVRGPGVWVPRREVPNADILPVQKDGKDAAGQMKLDFGE